MFLGLPRPVTCVSCLGYLGVPFPFPYRSTGVTRTFCLSSPVGFGPSGRVKVREERPVREVPPGPLYFCLTILGRIPTRTRVHPRHRWTRTPFPPPEWTRGNLGQRGASGTFVLTGPPLYRGSDQSGEWCGGWVVGVSGTPGTEDPVVLLGLYAVLCFPSVSGYRRVLPTGNFVVPKITRLQGLTGSCEWTGPPG